MAKRSQAEQRSSTLRRLGRSITGTGGLLLAAAVLLVFSWALLDQGSKLRQSPLGGEQSADLPVCGPAGFRRPYAIDAGDGRWRIRAAWRNAG